ncbi:hypothetical protein [Sphingobium sp. SCG-1]|nr:hypothetical protein [Sphingobium sp. SCG-1]
MAHPLFRSRTSDAHPHSLSLNDQRGVRLVVPAIVALSLVVAVGYFLAMP